MLALKLCQQVCASKIDFRLSNRLGDGADGEVFELKDRANTVIKFCVLYEYPDVCLKSSFNKIDNILSFIKNNHPPAYARVYEHMYLGSFNRPIECSAEGQNYILYYYTMEKLIKISEDEKRVFHSILCHEDRNIKKDFSINKIKKMLDGMGRALDFDAGSVILFCENLKKSNIVHNDIHIRNIMKDKDGNFKLIDFDRCDFKN